MDTSRSKPKDLFYEEMDAARLHRIQSEYMTVWDDFKRHAEARGLWHAALRLMVTEHRSFAETAAFIGCRLPQD
jgi:hypothetical protein